MTLHTRTRRGWARLATTLGVASALALGTVVAATADVEEDAPEAALVEPAEAPAETLPATDETEAEGAPGTDEVEFLELVEGEADDVAEAAPELAAIEPASDDDSSDDPVVAPAADVGILAAEMTIAPSERTQREMEMAGVRVIVTGLEPGVSASFEVNGEFAESVDADEDGWADIYVQGRYAPGTYTVTMTAGGESASGTFTVEEGGYSLWLFLDTYEISQWDAARAGIFGEGRGFSLNSPVALLIDGQEVAELMTDDEGSVDIGFTANLPAGETTLTLAAPEGEVSQQLNVVADDEYYADYDFTPSVSADRFVVTVSEIEEEAVQFDVRNFPNHGPVDISVNGTTVETIFVNSLGNGEYHFGGTTMEPGQYTIAANHPVGTYSAVLDVVPDAQGTPAPAGRYTGTALQTHTSSRPTDDGDIRPFSFDIDAQGNISGVTGEYWWACVSGGGFFGSGFSDFSDDPVAPTPLTVGQPFEVTWTSPATDYTLVGTVNADGSASGRAWASLGVCGSTILEWSTQGDGDYTPTPTPTPTPT
ncbi:MAG: hypothetical protein GX596_08425, partial [Propionibacterium sp.]|nr:hypothetical protein [Propionibacterium sp.]